MVGVGAADNDLSVRVKLECHLGADINPQRLTDRLGHGGLALRGQGSDFVDERDDWRSFCRTRLRGMFLTVSMPQTRCDLDADRGAGRLEQVGEDLDVIRRGERAVDTVGK